MVVVRAMRQGIRIPGKRDRPAPVWTRVATALVIGVAVGCMSGVAAQPGHDASPAPPRKLTLDEEVRLDQAEEHLIKVCMERRGFRYWGGSVASVAERQISGYVLTDVATARQHGYGAILRAQAEDRKENEPNARYANALPEAERIRLSRAYFGDPAKGMLTIDLPAGGTISRPATGCLAEAEQALYGDLSAWFRAKKIATGLTSLYVPDLIEDPRFVAALREWSECMSRAGQHYRTPAQIRERLPELTAGTTLEQAHRIEVTLATAEVTCATTTPLARTARELEQEFRATKLRPYQADIATYERMRTAALHRAEHILDPTP